MQVYQGSPTTATIVFNLLPPDQHSLVNFVSIVFALSSKNNTKDKAAENLETNQLANDSKATLREMRNADVFSVPKRAESMLSFMTIFYGLYSGRSVWLQVEPRL